MRDHARTDSAATAGARNRAELAACPSAEQTAADVRSGRLSARVVIEACLERIAALEDAVKAWHTLDPDQARRAAQALDASGSRGALAGVPVGLKDTIDTADMPTENGSVVDEGRRPARDATVALRLRRAGAVFPGKLVTTVYAYYTPGKTRNPHHLEHTPGGSSSGSAAAVASGMVPVALGSQTVGSVIRPAAFCGVWGMKPSYGAIPATGYCPLAPSLDTPGVFARSARDLALVLDVISGDDGEDEAAYGAAPLRLLAALERANTRPRIAFVRSFAWPELEPGLAALYEQTASSLEAEELVLPAEPFHDAAKTQRVIMTVEAREALGPVLARARARLPALLIDMLEESERYSAQDYLAAKRKTRSMRRAFADLMDGFDAAITPPARGEAPRGLDTTGDPVFCLLWTLLGAPAVTVPAFTGPKGLPLGLQVVAPRGQDAAVLGAALAIAERLGVPR